MTRRFAKYEGLGNDFVVIDAAEGEVTAQGAMLLCDRRHGIGADGVLVIAPSREHDATMHIFNADGSTPEMCGNGIRCVALHIASLRGLERAELTIATDAGPRACFVERRGHQATVRVDMGIVRFVGDRVLEVDGESMSVAVADAGNPHAVRFGDFTEEAIDALGPSISKNAAFPAGTNVELAKVDGDAIHLVVWERGVGRTLACGTGACATAVVARVKGLVKRARVRVSLPGGDLEVEPGIAIGSSTFMTGPATRVFRGETDVLGPAVKAMLVTQQDEVRRIIAEVLAGSGDEVLPATDLAAGLALSAEHTPELAIIDMALAGGAALAMVHHILASSPRTAIYVLAVPAAFDTAAEALSLGAAGVIVAPPTGDSLLRAIADVHARLANDERSLKLSAEARDAAELIDAMTQALVVAKAGDLRALGETLLALFLIASGARGVAMYGEEESDGTRRRIAGYGTALELLDRYNDLELAQLAPSRHAEIVGLAVAAHMYGCILLERPDPMRTARIHRITEFATALMPLCTLARTSLVEDETAPRPRALPAHVFKRLVQRELDAAREDHEVTLLCAASRNGEIDTGPLGPALALAGAAIGTGDAGEVYVLLPKTPMRSARSLLLDVPLAVGLVSAPADGKDADHVLSVAHARARRALDSFPPVRELRTRPLAAVVAALWSTPHPTLTPLAGSQEAIESMVLHACRHARGAAEVVVAQGKPAGFAAVVATARAASGPSTKVRDVEVSDAALAGALVALVLTPRAGWALVVREHQGALQALHTSDALVLELLRGRLAEVL